MLIKSLRGTGGRLRRFLVISPFPPQLLLISMHERKAIFCTARSLSELPGRLGKGRRTVGVAKPGVSHPFAKYAKGWGTLIVEKADNQQDLWCATRHPHCWEG